MKKKNSTKTLAYNIWMKFLGKFEVQRFSIRWTVMLSQIQIRFVCFFFIWSPRQRWIWQRWIYEKNSTVFEFKLYYQYTTEIHHINSFGMSIFNFVYVFFLYFCLYIFQCAFIILNKINTDRRSFRSIDSKTIHKGKSNNVVSTQRSSDLWIFRQLQLFKRLVYFVCKKCVKPYFGLVCMWKIRAFSCTFILPSLFDEWKMYERYRWRTKSFIRWKNEECFKNGSLIAQCKC